MSRVTVARSEPDAPPVPDADGRSTRWDGHRAERRAELCRAARRAVHHRGPDLSMDEMAAAMGTSKSIVYRYFTDKAGLQAAVGTAVLDEMSEALGAAAASDAPAKDRLKAMVAVYVRMLSGSPNVYRFVTRTENQESTISTFAANVAAFGTQPLLVVLAELGADPRFAGPWAAGMVGFVRGTGEAWLAEAPENRLDPELMVDLVSDWIWSGAHADIPEFRTV